MKKILAIIGLVVSCTTPKNIANNRVTYNTNNSSVVKARKNLFNNYFTIELEKGVKIRNVPACMFPFDSLKIIDYRGKYYWVD